MNEARHAYIAYRCPSCVNTMFGIVTDGALSGGLYRIKCSECQDSALEVTRQNGKIKLSVPCFLCNKSHTYTLPEDSVFERDILTLGCPYANIDICFIGGEDKITEALQKNADDITRLLKGLGADDISDIQPEDVPEGEVLPDAAVYDCIRFILKDLEADGRVHCPCDAPKYDLRYTDDGIEAYCENCGATYIFKCKTLSIAEEYLSLDEIRLS